MLGDEDAAHTPCAPLLSALLAPPPCSHLLEHEDNEMMLPFCIGQPGHKDPKTGENICPLSDP